MRGYLSSPSFFCVGGVIVVEMIQKVPNSGRVEHFDIVCRVVDYDFAIAFQPVYIK